MKNILVPVGTSVNARSHLKYAVDFAKVFGAKIYLVQIYNVYTKAGTFIKVDDLIIRKSMEFLREHVASVDTRGVDIEVKTFKGDVVDILESVCETLEIDLIILEPRTNSVKDEVYLGKDSLALHILQFQLLQILESPVHSLAYPADKLFRVSKPNLHKDIAAQGRIAELMGNTVKVQRSHQT